MKKHNTILMVGTSTSTRGGVAAVIKTLIFSSLNTDYRFLHLVTHVDGGKLRKIICLLKALLIMPIQYYRSDLIHIHSASYNSCRRKTLFMGAAYLLRRPYLIHIHGGDFRNFLMKSNTINWYVYRFLFKRAKRVVCLVHKQEQSIAPLLGLDNIMSIPNPSRFSGMDERTISSSSVNIIFVGMFELYKGVNDLLSAWALLKPRHPGLKLTIAGKGKEECSWRGLSEKLGIAEQIEWRGWLDSEGMEALYQTADIICLPSYIEAMPMVLLEAMAKKVAIVCTPVGGIPDILQDDFSALMHAAGDVNALSQCLRKLIESTETRSRLIENAYREYNQKYTVEAVAQQWKELYEVLL